MSAMTNNILEESALYSRAVKALDGRLGHEPDSIVAACRDYVGVVDAIGDFFGEEVEGWHLPQQVEVLVSAARERDQLLADGDPAYDAAEDAGELELPTPQVRVEHRGGVRVEHHFIGTSTSAALSSRTPFAEPTAQRSEPTAAELVVRCNELAAVMCSAQGWAVGDGYEFHLNLDQPRPARAWEFAALVLEHLEGHEMADALAEVLQFPAGSPFAAPTAGSAKDDRNG